MTCIVGLVVGDDVYIGADAISSNGITKHSITTPKVFRCGEFAIGYTTSFRMGQLIQFHLPVRPQPAGQDDFAYMVTEVAEAVRVLLKDRGFAEVNSNRERGGQFLIGYRGKLYEIHSDYAVFAHEELWAVGSGEEVALGAMAALVDMKPRKRIKRALEIAAHYVPTVQGPFTILQLEGAAT